MLNCYEIGAGSHLASRTTEEIEALVSKGETVCWIDLQGSDALDLEEWLPRFGVAGLARRMCMEAGTHPGFQPMNAEMLLVIPVLVLSEAGERIDTIGFYCRENLLLSWHQELILGPDHKTQLDEADSWLPSRSAAGLVSSIILDLSQTGLQHAADLREEIGAVEDLMNSTPDKVKSTDLLALRSKLITYDTVYSDQLPPVQALSSTDKPYFRIAETGNLMNYSLVNLQAADRRFDRLEQRVGNLHSGFEMHTQDRTNRRLSTLTILSAIFMPITLMAGIWGMNFTGMPELELKFGYAMGLGLMSLVGTGMFLFFRRDGWFG